MKKTYTKPLLFAESYQMVEHIAGTCNTSAYNATHNTGWTCSITGVESGLTLFTAQQLNCGRSVDEDHEILDGSVISDSMMSSMIGSLCYNQFEQGQMFSS